MQKFKQNDIVCVIYFLIFLREVIFGATKISDLLPESLITMIYRVLLLGIVFLGGIVICFYERFSMDEKVKIAIFLGITFSSVFITRQYMLLEAVILIVCCKEIELDKVLKFVLKIQITLILLVIILALVGVIGIGDIQRNAGVLRYSLGFSHPNRLAMLIFQICCEIFYLNRNRVTWIIIAVCIALNIISYAVTNSNTAFIINIVFDMALIIYKTTHLEKEADNKHVRRLFYIFMFAAIVGGAIFIGVFIRNPDYFINVTKGFDTLYSRFRLIPKYYNAYGIKLFGNKIVEGTKVILPGYEASYGYLDCGYAALFIRDGILFAVMFLVGIAALLRKKVNEGNWALVIILILCLIYFMLEKPILDLGMNVFWIMLADVVYIKSQKRTSA
mgnify:CR=1 FL=1